MKKVSVLLFSFFILINLTGCSEKSNNDILVKKEVPKITIVSEASSSLTDKADILQVYYFHGVARCSTCVRIGKYVRETVEQNFSNELASRKLDYQEINIDAPENKELVEKFQASGSSLYLNAIRNDKDDIQKDMYVWKIVKDETLFKTYLSDRINSFLD